MDLHMGLIPIGSNPSVDQCVEIANSMRKAFPDVPVVDADSRPTRYNRCVPPCSVAHVQLLSVLDALTLFLLQEKPCCLDQEAAC